MNMWDQNQEYNLLGERVNACWVLLSII